MNTVRMRTTSVVHSFFQKRVIAQCSAFCQSEKVAQIHEVVKDSDKKLRITATIPEGQLEGKVQSNTSIKLILFYY